jgi:hypothetical protein
MKSTYIFFGVIALLMFNVMLINRDKQLFEAYDKVCAELPQPHPNCRYAK